MGTRNPTLIANRNLEKSNRLTRRRNALWTVERFEFEFEGMPVNYAVL
jgi:hypothetical protein